LQPLNELMQHPFVYLVLPLFYFTIKYAEYTSIRHVVARGKSLMLYVHMDIDATCRLHVRELTCS